MTFIILARQNQFIQEIFSNIAPVRRIANARNTNSAFTASFTENPLWYQLFGLRQIRIIRVGQLILDFDAADTFRHYVTTIKAINFQDDISSIPIDNFKDHDVLVFDLTSIQVATEHCHHPEQVGEALSMEPNFAFLFEYNTELIVLAEGMSSVEIDNFGVDRKNM